MSRFDWTIWLGLAAALLQSADARAQGSTAPVSADLLTERSSYGGIAFEIEGASPATCESIARHTTFGGASEGQEPTLHMLGTCRYFLQPSEALPPGEHCPVIPDLDVEPSPPCVQVTGELADPALATVTLGTLRDGGPTESLPESCEPCTDGEPSQRACTRRRFQWEAVLRVEGVAAELGSTHTFAFAAERGTTSVATPLPSDPTWLALDAALAHPVFIPIPGADEEACVEVYGRSMDEGEVVSLGRQCSGPQGWADVGPTPFSQGSLDCDPTFRARWCADNAADCVGTAQSTLPPYACQTYSAECGGVEEKVDDEDPNSTATDASIGMGNSSGSDGGDMSIDGTDASSSGENPTNAPSAAGSTGCQSVQQAQRPAAMPAWLMFILGSWAIRRSQRAGLPKPLPTNQRRTPRARPCRSQARSS